MLQFITLFALTAMAQTNYTQLTSPPPAPKTAISIIGPETGKVNDLLLLNVDGLQQADLSRSKLVYWPENGLQVLAMQTWDGKPVLFIRAFSAGTYLIQIMLANNSELVYARHVLTITSPNPPGPTPDPKPPGPTPDPNPPEPKPTPTGKYTFVIVEETAERVLDHAVVILSKEVRDYITSRGWTIYAVDKDVVDRNKQTPAVLKQYIDHCKSRGLPWVVMVNEKGDIAAEYSLPNTPAEFLRKIQESFTRNK